MNLLFKNVIVVAFNGVCKFFPLCWRKEKRGEKNEEEGRKGEKEERNNLGSLLLNKSVFTRC